MTKLFTTNWKTNILTICVLCMFMSCKTVEPDLPPPNIVWIVSEDNSKHYLKLFDENGVETPNIKALADHGVIFDHAFSNAPVCSVARSTLITGSYAPRIGAQFHRKMKTVPMPENLEMFPYYLRQAGYYTTNNAKEDYNLTKSDSVWDQSSGKATWRNRKENQPFFHVVNFGDSHESRLHFTEEDVQSKKTITDVNSFSVQPNHPNTDLFKYTNAFYRDKIQHIDSLLGNVVKELEADGLIESTIIFYYGDHGGVLPGSKGYIYETGVHVPLVVRIPEKYKNVYAGALNSRENAFVSFIDFGPTVLNLAGVAVPETMDGKPFLGANITSEELKAKDETFSYADRFDEKYDMVRAVRKGKYKYIRNYEPFNFDGLMNNYRYIQLAYQEWANMYEAGELNETQSRFFKEKAPEYLFNVEADPFETNNLAEDETYKDVLKELRNKLTNWVKEMPDLSFYPEFYLINNAFDNPVEFGQTHKNNIRKYVDIANLSLQNFDEVWKELENALKSNDMWDRYWAIIASTSFKETSTDLLPIIEEISQKDSQLINKVRALEYLALVNGENPVDGMTKALYASKDGGEALQILNSMVLMSQGDHHHKFNLKRENLSKEVIEETQVERRLEYLIGPKPE